MKKILTALLALISLFSYSQVGIGTNTPNANAVLELSSTTQGMKFPRLTTSQRTNIVLPAKGLTVFDTQINCLMTNFGTPSVPVWKCIGGLPIAVVSAYSCSTASAGTMIVGTAVSGVTQTITATVTTVGTYSISATANGVTFAASGTFAGTGAQNIVLTATGTPTAKGSNTYTLNTTPNCNFSRYASVTGCYARISASPDVFKDFLCHNLGADITLDPHVPVVGLQGAHIKWGRRGPNTTGNSSVDWQTAANDGANGFAAAPTDANPNNAASINLWNTAIAANNSWLTAAGAKTANDPCPTGYRVPTSAEWTGVNSNNTASTTGTFSNNATNYGVALHYGPNASTKLLTLPAAGFRYYSTPQQGKLFQRGETGYYWGSSTNILSPNAPYMSFQSSGVNIHFYNRAYGYSIRCIEVDNPSTNGTAVVSGFTCSTASAGTMTTGSAVSGVSQTITATVTTIGSYGITAYANGVTFTATGTFSATGAQTVVLTATGTPTAAGTNTFTLNTTPSCSFTRTVSLGSLPANITLSAISPYFVASVYDQDYLPYTAPTVAASLATAQAANGNPESFTLDVQGALNTTGVTLKIPYTVVTATVTLPAFSQTINVPASYTEDGIARDVTFSYSGASLGVGSGTINATLQAVGNTLNAKKLDIQTGIGNDYLGWLLAQFTYATNNSGGAANFQFRNIAAVPDRNIADANHVMFYMPVLGADGKTWLNNNLGADYSNTAKTSSFSPATQATASNDFKAYGSAFQWGRGADNHELITWTSTIDGTPVNAATSGTSSSTTPGSSFLAVVSGTGNWYTGSNPDNLWQGVNGTNNPCPIGYRLPTETELNIQQFSWSSSNSAGALASPLKLPMAGTRDRTDGLLYYVGATSDYWSSTYSSIEARGFMFDNSGTGMDSGSRAFGYSVRCIKD